MPEVQLSCSDRTAKAVLCTPRRLGAPLAAAQRLRSSRVFSAAPVSLTFMGPEVLLQLVTLAAEAARARQIRPRKAWVASRPPFVLAEYDGRTRFADLAIADFFAQAWSRPGSRAARRHRAIDV